MKKHTMITLSVLAAIAIVALGGTYAWLTWSGSGTQSNAIEAGTLSFSYSDGSAISLTEAMPATDASAKAETLTTEAKKSVAERTVTITNTGTVPAYWYLYVDNTSTIPAAQLSIVYKKSTDTWANAKVAKLSDTPALDTAVCTTAISNLGLTTSTTRKLIGCGTAGTDTTKTVTYNVRVYINDTATTSNINGKTATIKLTPYGTQSTGR